MAHTSKLSRLPRPIRDQLNQRLDDSEPSTTLLQWLNSLPEVQAILAAEFDGRPVSKQNLADWKKTAFRNWQIRRTALDFVADDSDQPSASESLTDSITQKLAHWVSLRYAALAHSLAPSDEDPGSELRQLSELCAAVVSLRRGDLNAERVLLEQKRLALLASTTDQEREKLFWEWTTRPDIQAKLYPQRDREQARREVERVLNYRLLGIPYHPNLPDETFDPAILI